MRNIFLTFILGLSGCVTKPFCINSNESFRAIYDPTKGCSIRIREVVIGSDLNLPKSLSLSDSQWGYRWVESSFKDGVLELGHFVLVPVGNGTVR